jgi:hypothetical protein
VLYDPVRHERLGGRAWSPGRARDAIAGICRDAEAAFDPVALWPLHPADFEPGTPDVLHGMYLGAAGMLHGLMRLGEFVSLDLAGIAARLPYDQPDEEGAGASLLAGSSGVLLVAHRLAGVGADALYDAVVGHASHPADELLLGTPGTMLAARAMSARTGEGRWEAAWQASADAVLARRCADGLWPHRLLGAAHGLAGVAFTLGEPDPLTVEAVRAHAVVEDGLANWPVAAGHAPSRVQWCHGAPGIITSIALDDEIMRAGGELVWHAGPLRGNPGLCHGTAGNGYAFLALFDRTRDELWLTRARAFAMHALDQASGRYGLFTGDIGAALLAAACLDGGDHRFPGLADL